MKIAIANQKGGTGKTTVCITFEHYLRSKNLISLNIDFDIQLSWYNSWLSATTEGEEQETVVSPADLNKSKSILQQIKDYPGIVLFDLAGSIANNNLSHVLHECDLILCPFQYEAKSFASTLTFLTLLEQMHVQASIVTIPNMVQSNVSYGIKEQVQAEFKKYATIAPEIKHWVDMQRINYTNINKRVIENTTPTFDFISENFLLNIK